MKMAGSILFAWIQGAAFYREIHRRAVELLPPGDGKAWLDVGCGPGLVSRLAAQRGYRVTGVDSDARMLRAARRLARRVASSAAFEQGSVFDLAPHRAEVVSACSLLAILGARQAALEALWSSVRAGGALLIVEPSERLTRENARRVIEGPLPQKRLNGLLMWASARQGRSVPPALYRAVPAAAVERTDLFHGLVDAWLLLKR